MEGVEIHRDSWRLMGVVHGGSRWFTVVHGGSRWLVGWRASGSFRTRCCGSLGKKFGPGPNEFPVDLG